MSTTQSGAPIKEPTVLVTQEGVVRTITLNRPALLNAVNDAVIQDLLAALEGCSDDSIRTVIIRGAGRAFCSGHDLNDAPNDSSDEAARIRLDRYQELTRVIRALPVPVITVVHGWAVGAGAELALSSDFVIAADDSKFRFPEVGLGLAIMNGASYILAAALGPQRAKRFTFLGENIDAAVMHQAGLVSHLVKAADMESELARLVSATTNLPPVSTNIAKQLFNSANPSNLEQILLDEVDASTRLRPREFAGKTGLIKDAP